MLIILGLLVLIAVIGLVMVSKSGKTGEAIYASPKLCLDGYTSHSADSQLLAAKIAAGEECEKSMYVGWYCCPTKMK
jgi:hypothetical protein